MNTYVYSGQRVIRKIGFKNACLKKIWNEFILSKYSAMLGLLTAKNTAEHQECMIKNKFIFKNKSVIDICSSS